MDTPKFTPVVSVFDPLKDVAEVDQFGAIDLRSAFVNHAIPEDVVLSAESYNGVEDAQSLLGRPSDVFDAIRKAEYVSRASSSKKASTAEAGEATSSGNE